MPPDLIDQDIAAAFLDRPPRTLEDWRFRGVGPPYVKIGRSVRYRVSDLEEWLRDQTVRPAS